jgi:hypothetical protein
MVTVTAAFVPFAGCRDIGFEAWKHPPENCRMPKKISFASARPTYARLRNLAHRLRVLEAEPIPRMKKNFLLIATLAVLASTAGAASSPTAPDVFVLPAYVVTASRELPAEHRINASLAELRKSAKTPIAFTPDANLHKAREIPSAKLVQAARAMPRAKS